MTNFNQLFEIQAKLGTYGGEQDQLKKLREEMEASGELEEYKS